ncbi:hypothetical protein [Streptomyces sp. SM18]|uniref:scabin-related ADP-ribosyltransferase n=2 Tax=unclassified Streptomyces TaxID=2593676 RepID=UPI0035C6AF72
MRASPEVNAMLFILTGERLLQADEDLAYSSRQPYGRLGKRVRELSQLVEDSVKNISTAMPDDVGRAYVRAMSMLTDDGGKNYLREFGDQLDRISDGRVKASMDIMESKWQVIAEVIRLLIEIAFYLAMSFFTGGASLTQIALAKARSRLLILTTLSHLLQRTHLLPSLTEALSEAFTTFAVRLAMMLGAPAGRRPGGFDWGQILKDAAFGAIAGGLASIFHNAAHHIVKGYDNNFLKNGPDLDFKNGPDLPKKGPDLPKNGPDLPKNGPDLPKSGPDLPKSGPDLPKNGPDLPKNGPDLPKNGPNWPNAGPGLPGAGPGAVPLTGHHAIKETSNFLASGGAESLAEILAGGLLYGDWSTSWSTFVGAGVSDRVGTALNTGAVNTGTGLRDVMSGLRGAPPPTVSTSGLPPSGKDTSGHSGLTTTGTGDGGTGAPDTHRDNASGDERTPSSTQSPPPPYEAPPPYRSLDGYGVNPAESDLWRQVHTGSPQERADALNALAELRGGQPGTVETEIRDTLHRNLANGPGLRVVADGQGTGVHLDTDHVRHTLDSLGSDSVRHDPPGTSATGPGGTTHSGGGVPVATTGSGPSPQNSAPTTTHPHAPDTDTDTSTGSNPTTDTSTDTSTGPNPTTDTGPNPTTDTGSDAHTDTDTAAVPDPTQTASGDHTTNPAPAPTPPAPAPTPTPPVATPTPPPASAPTSTAAPNSAPAQTPGGARTTGGGEHRDAPVVTSSPETVDHADPRAQVTDPDSADSPPPDNGDPEVTHTDPLTVVVTDGPLPYDDPAEAARLLDLAGGDRAVVLGPPTVTSATDTPAPGTTTTGTPTTGAPANGTPGRGTPSREAAVLTRDSPDGPVRVRPLSTVPPVTGPDGDLGAVFPGADVLLPLSAALGPDTTSASASGLDTGSRRPVTESSATVETVSTAETTPNTEKTAPPTQATPPPPPEQEGSRPLDTETSPAPSPAPHPAPDGNTTTPRDPEEVASDLLLESGPTPTGSTPQPTAPSPPLPPSTTPAPKDSAWSSLARFVARPFRSADSPGRSTPSVVTTLDGHTLPVDQVRRLLADGVTGPRQGTAVRTLTVSQSPAEDNTPQSAARQRLLDQDGYRDTRRVTSTPTKDGDGPPPPRTVFTGPSRPLPGSGTPEGADYFVAHGTPRTVTLGTNDSALPSVVVSGVQLGEVLRAWGAPGDRTRPLVLFSCETGKQPRVAGLPVAQHVANRTGRPVYAPTSEAGTAKDSDGVVRAVLTEGTDGPGEWRLFTPEPSGRRLDALARSAGLHGGRGPADAFTRARTLQAVRTLRGTLGPDAEQLPNRRELLRGLAFAEGLRWRTPDPAGRYADARMTPDLLRRMVADRYGLADGTEPSRDQYTGFLSEAARLRSGGGPEVTLRTLIPPPAAEPSPSAPVYPQDVRGLAYAHSARVTWLLSDGPLPLSELGLSPEDTATLLRRRPDLVPGTTPAPATDRPATTGESVTDLSVVGPPGGDTKTPLVRADDRDFRRTAVPGDGDCFFRSVLLSARGQNTLHQWADLDVSGLRDLLSTRLTGSELADALTESAPDPVLTVLGDLREHFIGGAPPRDEAGEAAWERASDAILAGDAALWRRLLLQSPYPGLLEVAPTPEAARRLGSGGLLTETAGRTALWSSPFGDLLPTALARATDVDLRVVHDGTVTAVNPGGRGGTLYVAYNGRDHYEALTTPVPAPEAALTAPAPTPTPELAPLPPSPAPTPETETETHTPTPSPTPTPTPPPPSLPDPDPVPDPDPAPVLDPDLTPPTDADPVTTEESERVPLETQLERHRPPRLLTGDDALPPGPPPKSVTFEDDSHLPAVLLNPEADDTSGTPPPGGLMSGVGRTTLRGADQVADEILAHLPPHVRERFDDAELRRLLTEEPSAFTGPRGATFVARARSEVGYEVTVEAVPYHRWERLPDPDGVTVKLDTVHRGQATTGVPRSVGTMRRVAGALSMGPPLEWMLKLGASVGRSRRTDINTGTQGLSQTEMRGMDGSHLHLDDVYYRVRVDEVTPAPKAPAPRTPAPGDPAGPVTTDPASVPVESTGWRRHEIRRHDFAVRHGLTWRLQDSLTEPYSGPARAPKKITFPDGLTPRVTDTEALYLRDSPEDMALAMSGARPGSSAHQRLVSFLRPGKLLGLFPRLSGQVVGPELTRGGSHHPLGHLIVERAVAHEGTLVTEATKVEVRDVTQGVFQNDRTHTRETRIGVQVTAGPNHTLTGGPVDVRLQGGPMARVDVGAGRAHYLGGSAARKVTGRVKGTPVGLYRVEKTLYLRKPGEPASAARPFRVVTLDWLPTTEAKRLASWDTRTPAQSAPEPAPEPTPPPYLTQDDPTHLGQTRAEGFLPEHPVSGTGTEAAEGSGAVREADATAPDPMTTFADSVLDALHRSYPALFPAPWELRHPKVARLLRGDGPARTALHNDRQVREALNRPTLAQSLEVLTTTGVPVSLTETGAFRDGHHTLTLTAQLTDRRYETSLSERSLRNSVSATQQVGQGQQGSSTLSAGIEVGVSPRDKDKAPETGTARRTGWTTVGVRQAWGRNRATRNGVSVTNDHLTAQTSAHLFSYRVELNASFDGHRRPRGWARLVTVGALGAGYFVSRVGERPLFEKGTAPVGRVELAVPAAHSSTRYGPAPKPAVTPPSPAPTPQPEELSSTEAESLIDGTGPAQDPADPETSWTRDLLSRPFAVLGVEGARQRQDMTDRTAAQATGDSWHVTTPGTPLRNVLRRAMENVWVAGHLSQALGPFGIRTTGLEAAGPLQTHHVKAAFRARLHNLRVAGDPNASSFEVTTGADRRTTGSGGSSSRTTVGVQNSLALQQVDGHHPVHGSYAAGGQLSWGKGSSESRANSNGRNTILTYAGRTYPVLSDLTETVAVRDRWSAALGLIGTRSASAVRSLAGRAAPWLGRQAPQPRPAAARSHHVPDAVVMHVPMQDAIETGLAPDGLGTETPHHLGKGYEVPPFLRQRRFATHATGQLDASAHARELLPQLEALGVPSHDREQVLQMLSPDFLRGQVHELTTEGATLPVQYRAWARPGDLPTGGSPGQLRFQLTPVRTTVDRLRNGYEVEDYRPTGRDVEKGSSQDHGRDATLAVSESPAVQKGSGLLGVGPSLQGGAAGQQQSSRSRGVGRAVNPNIATTQSHAELITSYELTVTMTDGVGDALLGPVTGDVGTLRELLPVSLLTPETTGTRNDDTESDANSTTHPQGSVDGPERRVKVLTAAQARPDQVSAWRSRDSDLSLDDMVGTGFLAVDVLGAANVHDALTLATAQADGTGDGHAGTVLDGTALKGAVREARRTPLTVLGTAPAQALQEASGQTGLTAGLREALSPQGLSLPPLSSARLLGQSHTADARLYAKLDRRGARLLAVENKPRMEGAVRNKESDSHDAGLSGTVEGVTGTAPMAGTDGAGVITPGVSAPLASTTDTARLKGATEAHLGTHLKVSTQRSMLFALPVRWLSVVEADHHLTDGRAFRALGHARRGPRATEAETTTLVWVREDIAHDLGLLDTKTFPDESRTAWDRMAESQADMTEAEKRYYDARARARTAWLDMTEAERDGALAEAATPTGTTSPEAAGTTPKAPVPAEVSRAVTDWRAAREEALLWEARTVEAAEQTRRLHAAAERVTARHYGQAPATEMATEKTSDKSSDKTTAEDPASPAPDDPSTYTKPEWRSETPPRYTVSEATESGLRTLTAPGGGPVLEVHAVPHDGASFFHALITAAAHHDRLPPLLGTTPENKTPVAAPGHPDTVEAVRSRLVEALGQRGNEDLLAALAPEGSDTFTKDELTAAKVPLDAPHRKEFETLGTVPQSRWLDEGERLRLAAEALSRTFASGPAAWDHGAADLLPALAARVLRLPVTVVTSDGVHQRFLPPGVDPVTAGDTLGPELTLFVADKHFHVALPEGTPAPYPAPVPPPATEGSPKTAHTPAPPVRPSPGTLPWAPPTKGTGPSKPRYRLGHDGVLTAPDGATYTQGTPTGRGNAFFGALSEALTTASRRPGLLVRHLGRMRAYAGSPPGRLMRLYGMPGAPTERDGLFRPPPVRTRRGQLTPSDMERDRLLRAHIGQADWGTHADRAMAEWAARTSGVTVTLVEEDGTAHTFPGGTREGAPAIDAHVVLRRRGGDFVPLLPHTPAPATPPPTTPTPPAPVPPPPPPAPAPLTSPSVPPLAAPPVTPPPPALLTPPSPTGSDLPGMEDALELSTLSGATTSPAPSTPMGDTSTDTSPWPYDREWEALTSGASPVVREGDGWTVWGHLDSDPDLTELVAENKALGLRGVFRAEGSTAGRGTDASGRPYDRGPAWDWYHPTHGLIGSSPFRPAPDRTPADAESLALPPRDDTTTAPVPPVPPHRTAAQSTPSLDELPHPMRWRTDTDPLYRFAPLGPQEVFLNGLRAKGTGLAHVLDHVHNGTGQGSGYVSAGRDTEYVATSIRRTPEDAAALDARYRWRYDLDLPGGIDVNGTLGMASPHPGRREVLFPGGVAPRFIRGAQRMLDGEPFGPYRANPEYHPLPPPARRDNRPRYVVNSGFDARRFTYGGEQVTDLTVRIAVNGPADQTAAVLKRLNEGVAAHFNAPGHHLPNGDRLHVTVEPVERAEDAHLTVELIGREREMTQSAWWTDATATDLAHELAHQLGLRDEYRDGSAPQRPQVTGSLLGAYEQAPPDPSLAPAGLRSRHLHLLSAVIGDLDAHTGPVERNDAERDSPDPDRDDGLRAARAAAPPVTRRTVWVDPVSLPRPDDQAAGTRDQPESVAPRAPRRGGEDPEKVAFETFEHELTSVAFRPDAVAADFSASLDTYVSGTDPETRTRRVKKARSLIDGLPDHYPDESVNAAHAALDTYDHARPALAVPGARYVSASYVSGAVGNGYINRDIPGVVIVEGEPYAPVFSTVYADALHESPPRNKDVGQDAHGLIQIHTGDSGTGERVLWVSVGQSLRQLKWMDKYAKHGKAPLPLIRSFLVPLHVLNDISRKAVTEHNSGGDHTEDLNVDKHFAANQFGIREPESLEALRQFALPGSLRTYTYGDTEGAPASWGEVRDAGELREKLGIPTEDIPGFPVFTDDSGEFLSHSKYAEKTSVLRRIASAHTNTTTLLEKSDRVVPKSFVKEFFWKHAPQHLKDQANQGRPEYRRAADRFVWDLVLPWASQARIAEEIHSGFEEFLRSNPTTVPVDYSLTDEPATFRGERRSAAIGLGATHRELMEARRTIREGFEKLDFTRAFEESGTLANSKEVRALLGRLKNRNKEILDDYPFKIGDRDTLLAKNLPYAESARDFHRDLEAALPWDRTGYPGLAAVVAQLRKISEGVLG